jgi:geranylgeranyl pyrophosphate synthase
MRSIRDVQDLVRDELRDVSALIRAESKKVASPQLNEIVNYVLGAPGKMIRPTLVLLTYKALNDGQFGSSVIKEKVIQAAAAIELIHMASLVHDDVIDDADVRRNRPSVNAKWGNETSVATGVYLYSVSLALLEKVNDWSVLGAVSRAVKHMCEGEIIQLTNRENPDLMIRKALIILKKKTAHLFATAMFSGAVLSNCSPKEQRKLRNYGTALGMTFQLTDDYLDLVDEDQEGLGKSLGQDLDVGLLTIPILFLLRSATPEEQSQIMDLIKEPDLVSLSAIQQLMITADIEGQMRTFIDTFYQKNVRYLSFLPENIYKEALLAIADMVKDRGFKKTHLTEKMVHPAATATS